MEAETTALTHCSKHIALTHFFNKEHIKSGEIAPVYIPTEPELADVLTTNPTAMFDEQIKQLLGLVPKDNFTKYLKDHQTSYDKLQSRRVLLSDTLTFPIAAKVGGVCQCTALGHPHYGGRLQRRGRR